MLQRYLLLWLVACAPLAIYWSHAAPASFAWFADRWTLRALIITTMFAIGMLLPREEIRQVGRRWPTVLGGTAIQYISMPLLAIAAGKLFGFSGDYFVGLVMVGCVPGAMASNILTLNAHGNTSYSVSLTTSATLLSPLAVPLVMGLALASDNAVGRMVLLRAAAWLLGIVVVPVIAGHWLGRSLPNHAVSIRKICPVVANLVILWIIAAVVGKTSESLLSMPGLMLAALLMINLGGYLCGYGGGLLLQLDVPMRRALTLEVGMQNAGLGAALASTLFTAKEAAIAPAIYAFGCMLTGTILSRVWATRSLTASASKET